jgi:uncharacterized repeat protein (TIGR03803 family)
MRPTALLLAFLILPSLGAQGQRHFRVLHAFGAGHDGAGVWDSVAFDRHGNLYGTTSGGGDYGYGTVFRVSPELNGQRKETVLESFKPGDPRGAEPKGGLIVDAAGNLYGTTSSGGRYGRLGTAFELTTSQGKWTLRVLHKFGGRGDPTCCPWGNLVAGEPGNLYGTGSSVFELSLGAGGWIENVLHDFNGKNGDGLLPQAGPIRDPSGNLYGTTLYGGGSLLCADGCGTVWELEPSANNGDSGAKVWTERILHRFGFSLNDGAWPGLGQLAMDREGTLYGTANGGGFRSGVVFKLTRVPSASGADDVWEEAILYNFTGGTDGNHPSGGLILDHAGNLYGTTIAGGSPNCGCGVVFKLSPLTDGSWKYTLLHTFVGSDGAQPDANLTIGIDGNLYGTTATGGTNGGGVVFKLTP